MTDISQTIYARKREELFNLAQALRESGASSIMDVPRIAVIGSQSTGKSSLVEAVSGINVPRDSGTCTRCPMECSVTSYCSSWSCQISLRLDDSLVTFGSTITEKDQVELWIRRAQAAILSHSQRPETFWSKSYDDLRSIAKEDAKPFSKNAVVVEISDPEGTDLEFIDLPGLVHYLSGSDSEEAIELVRSLVVTTIQKSNTIILVTIPATDDIENQEAYRLAVEADPLLERTIVVLTKPDNLTSGDINMQRMRKENLQGNTHGPHYYCVRLPDDAQRARGISRDEANTHATAFFRSTYPWNELLDTRRLGIPDFIEAISERLVYLIEVTLPKLRNDADGLLRDCRDELAKLPAAITTEPIPEIMSRVTALCTDLSDAVRGVKNKDLVHHSRNAYKDFQIAIRRTVPVFKIFRDEAHERSIPLRNFAHIAPPREDLSETLEIEEDSSMTEMYLNDVREAIEDALGWELPYHVSYDTTKRIIARFITLWNAPAEQCFDTIYESLSNTVAGLIRLHFSRFKQLEALIRSYITEELDNAKEAARRVLRDTLETENVPYYTQNHHYLQSTRDNWLCYYTAIEKAWTRHVEFLESPTEFQPTVQSRVRRPLAEDIRDAQLIQAQQHFKTARRSLEEEMETMALVRAYFQVAYKRVIDYIPLTIDHSLSQAFVRDLQNKLVNRLNLGDSDPARLKVLLSENPENAANRARLEARKSRLEDIHQKLHGFVL